MKKMRNKISMKNVTSMKNKTTMRIASFMMLLLCISNIFCLTVLAKDDDTEKIVYSEEYTESLRQQVITELYGSREQYATDQTGDRKNYIDKEASKDGELVIDEERMNAVYESKLKEYDSKIDYDKVNSIVKERQEQLVKDQSYAHVLDENKVTRHKAMYFRTSYKYFACGVIIFLAIVAVYKNRHKILH